VTSSLPGGTIGTAYSQTLQAQDGVATYSYSLRSGTLPAGVTLANGELSGSPTTCGDYTFTLRVTDSQAQATFADRTFTVRVNDAQQSCVYVAPTTTTTSTTTTSTIPPTTTTSVAAVRQSSTSLPATGQQGNVLPLAAVFAVSGVLILATKRRRAS
jgi:LPXTG-motif cell wall-anchored protein